MATAFFFAFAQKSWRKEFFFYSFTLRKRCSTKQCSSHALNNLNKEALAKWESSFVSLKDKFIALTYIDMPEFKDVCHGILLAFNHRTGASCQTLSDIDPSLVIKEDLAMMDLRFSGLVKTVKIQELVPAIQDSIMKAHLYSKGKKLCEWQSIC